MKNTDAWGIFYDRSWGNAHVDGVQVRDREYRQHMERASQMLVEALGRFYADRHAG